MAIRAGHRSGQIAFVREQRRVPGIHNLLLLLRDWHQPQGVANTAELQRREKRLTQQQAELQKTGQTPPLIYTLLQRFTPATFKLIRWLRAHWPHPTTRAQALLQLRSLYAKL